MESDVDTLDVDALNALSRQLEERREGAGTGDGKVPSPYDSEQALAEGEAILQAYETLWQEDPSADAVRCGLAQHLYRLGGLYDDALKETSVGENATSSGDTFQELRQAALTQAVCRCMARSFHLLPSAYAANVLADLFRTVHFTATALTWYKEAEQAAGDVETIRSARRGRKALRKTRTTSDPPLCGDTLFPTLTTPGLLPPSLSAEASPRASSRRRRRQFGAGLAAACVVALGAAAYGGTQALLRLQAARALILYGDVESWKVRASSTHSPKADAPRGHKAASARVTFSPRNILDGRESTVWAPSRNLRHDGVGEWVEVAFIGRRKVTQVGLVTGFTTAHPVYGDVFRFNNRVKEALLTFSDRSAVPVTLRDEKPLQILTLPMPVLTSSVRITIVSVYPSVPRKAGKERWHDTPIAEVTFRGVR